MLPECPQGSRGARVDTWDLSSLHTCTWSLCVHWKLKVLVSQWCPTLWDSMGCSLPGSSVYGILQARTLNNLVELKIKDIFDLLISCQLLKLKLQETPDAKSWLIGKDLQLGKTEGQDIPSKFSSNKGTQPWASRYRLPKSPQNYRHLITHYWTFHCTPERRNIAPPTRTPTQASLTRKPWQATCTNPHTVRKRHNKENSTNCQNTERTPQTQQFKQDEETEEYPADKGTG